MNLVSLDDITGDGNTHSLVEAGDPRAGKYVQLLADPDNTGTIRVGGPNTTANRGLPLAPGASMNYSPVSEAMISFYPLEKIFYNAPNGDKLYVQYLVGA